MYLAPDNMMIKQTCACGSALNDIHHNFEELWSIHTRYIRMQLPYTKIVNEYDQEYHNHKLQTTPWHREEEPLNHNETPGRQIKQINQLSLPHQDDCSTRMDIK